MSDDHRRSRTSVPGVQVTVLGAFDLLIAGESVPLPQDGRRLLAYLALHGGPQPVHVPLSVAGPEAADAVDAAAPDVLLRAESAIAEVDSDMAQRLQGDAIAEVVAQVPDAWLQGPQDFGDPQSQRAAYVDYLSRRLAERQGFVQEAIRARA